MMQAQMMRAGLYKEVLVKLDESCQVKVALGSRRQLMYCREQIMGTIRGLLKIYGIKLGKKSKIVIFSLKVQEAIKDLDKVSKDSIEALVCSLEIIEESI